MTAGGGAADHSPPDWVQFGQAWTSLVYDRRILIPQIPALIERRYSKLTHLQFSAKE